MSASACYNIVVFGEPGVGKTCFIDQFCYGISFVPYDLDNSALSHEIVVDGRASSLTLMDLSTSFLKPEQSMHPREWAEGILAEADGIVLLYDTTQLSSFKYLINQAYRFLWNCRQSKDADADEIEPENFGCVLVGNKHDLVADGQRDDVVSQDLADQWAQTQGITSILVDSLARTGPENALQILVKNIWKLEGMALMKARGGWTHEEKPILPEIHSSIRTTLRGIFRPSST